MNLPRLTYSVILTGALAWCSTIVAAPYLASTSSWLAELVYRFFHPICHQLPERSFSLFGEKLGVCSRCASIYFAFLAGTLAYPLLYRRTMRLLPSSLQMRTILLFAGLPMMLDAAMELFGLHDATFVTRTITGGVFGLVVPFIVLPVAIEALQQLFVRHHSPSMNN